VSKGELNKSEFKIYGGDTITVSISNMESPPITIKIGRNTSHINPLLSLLK